MNIIQELRTVGLVAALVGGCLLWIACPNPTNPPAGTDEPHIEIRQDAWELASGDSILCGSTTVGTPKEVLITIENTGTGELEISGEPKVSIADDAEGSFSVTVFPASPLAAGHATTFTLCFDPATAGAKTATVSLSCNDPERGSFSFTACGEGTAVAMPEINLRDPLGGALASGSGSYAFADTTVGGSGEAQFTIENLGSGALHLDGSPRVAIGGANADQFTVTVQPSSPVAASGSTTFTVRFSPWHSTGLKSATVSIASDDADENPYTFAVSGTGTNLEWHGIRTVDTTGTTGGQPCIKRYGNLVLIAYYDYSNGALRCARSTDGGATWPAANIKTIDSTDEVGWYPSMASSDGGSTIYLSYYYWNSSTDAGAVKFAKSTDGGATWPAADIRTVAGFLHAASQVTSIAAAGTGVCIACVDSSDWSLKLARSSDGGATWPDINTIDPEGYHPSLAAEGSSVFLSYVTGSGVKCAASTDGGATWPVAGSIPLVSTAWNEANCLFLDSPYLYAAYNDGSWKLRFNKSTDSGATWPAEKLLAGTVSRYYGCALGGTRSMVYVAYYDSSSKTLKMTRSTDRGETWSPVQTVDSSADVGSGRIVIFVDGTSVCLAYFDATNGDLKFAKSTDGGLTW